MVCVDNKFTTIRDVFDGLELIGWPHDLLDDIIQRWSEPHRHYHGLWHLEGILYHCLQLADFYDLGQDDRMTLLLAAIYHDIIYVPGSDSNEWESGHSAIMELPRDLVFGHVIEAVRLAILKTKDHSHPSTFIEACLLDADLRGLGARQDVYRIMGGRVKAEYPDATEEQWTAGRKQWLTGMLGRKFIFHTGWGARREAAAQENLDRELREILGLERLIVDIQNAEKELTR